MIHTIIRLWAPPSVEHILSSVLGVQPPIHAAPHQLGGISWAPSLADHSRQIPASRWAHDPCPSPGSRACPSGSVVWSQGNGEQYYIYNQFDLVVNPLVSPCFYCQYRQHGSSWPQLMFIFPRSTEQISCYKLLRCLFPGKGKTPLL